MQPGEHRERKMIFSNVFLRNTAYRIFLSMIAPGQELSEWGNKLKAAGSFILLNLVRNCYFFPLMFT